MRAIGLGVLVAASAPAVAHAGPWDFDPADNPHAKAVATGIRWIKQTNIALAYVSGLQDINVVRIDLASPHVGFRASRATTTKHTVPSFATSTTKIKVAINGDFCDTQTPGCSNPVGLAISDGHLWSSDLGGPSYLALGADGSATLQHQGIHDTDDEIPAAFRQAVGGVPPLVWDGKVCDGTECLALTYENYPYNFSRAPRTASGLSAPDPSTQQPAYLYWVVVDGRADTAGGMNFEELGEFMRKELHVDRALNHDGGGSSTMWIGGEGVVNTPSDGSPRAVINQIGVVWGNPCVGDVRGYVRTDRKDPSTGKNGVTMSVVGGTETTTTKTGGPQAKKGYFELQHLPCDVWPVQAAAAGYQTTSRKAYVVPFAWASQVIQIAPGSPDDTVEDTGPEEPTGLDDGEESPSASDPAYDDPGDGSTVTSSPEGPDPEAIDYASGCQLGGTSSSGALGMALVIGITALARRRRRAR